MKTACWGKMKSLQRTEQYIPRRSNKNRQVTHSTQALKNVPSSSPRQVDFLWASNFLTSFAKWSKVPASHLLARSLTKTSKKQPRAGKCQSCLTKGKQKFKFFQARLQTSVLVSGMAIFKKALKLEKGKIQTSFCSNFIISLRSFLSHFCKTLPTGCLC